MLLFRVSANELREGLGLSQCKRLKRYLTDVTVWMAVCSLTGLIKAW